MNPSPEIPPQSYWFRYEGAFNAEMDTTLLQCLITLKRRGRWMTADIPDEALQTARLMVNHQHHCLLTMDDVVNRKHFLQLRYMTFRELAKEKRGIWDPATNIVTAKDKDWTKFFKKNSFAQAYRFKGEPEFRKMCYLFGPHDIKEESSNTQTAKLSSTKSPEGNVHGAFDLSDDEEINSPHTARRRLFDDGSSSGDRHSTTNHRDEAENQPIPPRNAIPPRYMGNSSSCASSSPNQFNWGPFH